MTHDAAIAQLEAYLCGDAALDPTAEALFEAWRDIGLTLAVHDAAPVQQARWEALYARWTDLVEAEVVRLRERSAT
jgi:hypothetical protein